MSANTGSNAVPTGNGGSNSRTYAPPTRRPTDSSYYDCHGIINHPKDRHVRDWHYARDVRAQVAAAGEPFRRDSSQPPTRRLYPSHYGNRPPLPLTVSTNDLMHVPITPGTTKPWKNNSRTKKGAHRAVYDNDNRSQVDVIYHDPKKIPKRPNAIATGFSMATYVPKAPPKVPAAAPAPAPALAPPKGPSKRI